MNYEDDPEFKQWKRHVEEAVVPMIDSSAVVMSIVPPDGKTDAKFAVELGLSIMMGKPIVLVVSPGSFVPDKLALVADEIIEGDMSTPEGRDSMARRLSEYLNAR